MTISVYVDGAGGDDPGYGYYVKESGESFYEKSQRLQIIKLNILQYLQHLKNM